MTELEYGINVANKFDLLFGDEDPSDVLTKAVEKKKKGTEKETKTSAVLKEKTAKSSKSQNTNETDVKGKDKDRKIEGKGRDDGKPKRDDRNRNAGQAGQQRPIRSAGAGGRAPDQFGKENATENRRPPRTDQQRSPAGGMNSAGPRRFGGPRPDGPRRSAAPSDHEFSTGATGDQEVPEQRVGFGGSRGFRGGFRGGAPRHFGTRDAGTEGQHARGREYERHSGSNKTGVKPVTKRDGGGAHNWGNYKDEAELQTETTTAEAPATGEETVPPVEGAPAVEGAEGETTTEEVPKEKTLKEFLEEEERNRVRPKYTIRAANDGEQETKVFNKMKRVQREKANADGLVEVVEYVEVEADVGTTNGKSSLGGPFQLVFASSARPSRGPGEFGERTEREFGERPEQRGGRGGRGGPGRGRGGPRGNPGGMSGSRGEGRPARGGRQAAPPAADDLNFPPLG